MIKINKQLTRPDGGIVKDGSVIDFKVIRKDSRIRFNITHWVDVEKKFLPIANVKNFSYIQIAEFQEGKDEEVQLKEIIDSKIGVGHTEIIFL